jgi:ubiquinone/menaquinone biosynthesis C-methylase UbiE
LLSLVTQIRTHGQIDRLDAIELGCGTAYVSAWLMRRGARVIGLDNSSNQLATARLLQKEFSLSFPLVHADAERPPFADASFDFVISQYGAATWCDPFRWIPEASRILRGGGRRDWFPPCDVLLSHRRRRCACGLATSSRLLWHAPVRVARTERGL